MTICETCNNKGYTEIYNTQDDRYEIQRCDECWSDNKPWSVSNDTEALAKAFKDDSFTPLYNCVTNSVAKILKDN